MGKIVIPIEQYLDLLTNSGVVPNFYCSEPYLITAKAKAFVDNGWAMVEADNWILFPPFPTSPMHPMAKPQLLLLLDSAQTYPNFPDVHYWSDFINYAPGYRGYAPVFLDYEYWYRAADFQYMKGAHWETFRKNCRKWKARRNGKPFTWFTTFCEEDTPVDKALVDDLFIEWMNSHNEGIQDWERVHQFITDQSLPKVWRYYLFDEDGRLLGINVADSTQVSLNFRYCISRPKEKFLNEYMRYYFMNAEQGYFVNDGGSLGNNGLEAFKDKLNPRIKRVVNSWYNLK